MVNFAQNFFAGQQAGRERRLQDEALAKQNRLAQLAGDAISAPMDGRTGYIAEIARLDPNTALRLRDGFQGEQEAQRKAGQERAAGMARFLAAMPTERRGALWQQLRPSLEGMGVTGTPEQWDESMLPLVQSLGGADQGAQSAQRAYVEWMAQQVPEEERGEFFRVQAGLAPKAQNQQFSPQRIEQADGSVRIDLVPTRGGNVAGGAPRPAGGMDSIIAQANAMAQSGVPEADIERYIAGAAQKSGIALTPAGMDAAANRTPDAQTYGTGQATNATRAAAAADAAAQRVRAETLAKAEAETEAAAPQRAKAAAALTDTINAVEPVLEKAINQVSGWTSGVGSWLSIIPGTQANDLQRNIETLQARLSFDELARMRAASPTGGALGAVSERELTLLGATVRSLAQDQSPAQLLENMKAIQYHYERWKMTVNGIDPDNPMGGQDGGSEPQVVRTGTTSDGRRVRMLADGRVIDDSGNEVR